VTIQSTGSITNPALPLTTLHSAKASFVQFLTPVIPSSVSETLIVQSTQPLEFTWQKVPGLEGVRIAVSLWDIGGIGGIGEIRCGFPAEDLHGTLPKSLLQAVKTFVSGVGLSGAILRVLVGDRKEVKENGVSYVIELGPDACCSNIPIDVGVNIQF